MSESSKKARAGSADRGEALAGIEERLIELIPLRV